MTLAITMTSALLPSVGNASDEMLEEQTGVNRGARTTSEVGVLWARIHPCLTSVSQTWVTPCQVNEGEWRRTMTYIMPWTQSA